jgi:hypothetical protein
MNRKLDLGVIDVERGSDYPPPFDAPCRDIERKRLGDGCYYSDIDMMIMDESPVGHTRPDGTPYARRSSNGEAE